MTRLKLRKGIAPLGSGIAGQIGWEELRKLPSGTHIACPHCNGHWFEVSRLSEGLELGCDKCGHWSIKLMVTNPTTDLEALGQIRCEDCRSKRWAIIKSGQFICIGCKSCPCQTVLKIPEKMTQAGIVLLQ